MFSTVAKRLGFSMFALAILVTGAGLIGSDIFPHVPFVIERAPESPAEYSERLDRCHASAKKEIASGRGRGDGIWGFSSSGERETFLANICMNVIPPNSFYTPTVGEYLGALAANVWERTGERKSKLRRSWRTEAAYWGARALVLGLFVWLLFDITIGRFIGWVVRGKNSE